MLELAIKNEKSVFLGRTEIDGKMEEVFMHEEDRFRHIQSFGASGTGKTTLMQNVIMQDIEMGNGVFVLGCHDDLFEDILCKIPKHRKNDVIYFDMATNPMSLNLLEVSSDKPPSLVMDLLFRVFDELYDLKKTGGPMFDDYMRNSIRLAMVETGSTLIDVCKILTDRDFRRYKLALCDDINVTNFWNQTLKVEGEASLDNMIPYLTSKLAPFVSDDFSKSVFGQPKSSINFRKCIDNNKIVLISLNKSMLGQEKAHLLGLVITELILSAGLSRADGLKHNQDGTITTLNRKNRTPFFVYLDQINNYLSKGLGRAIEELRLYKVGLYVTYNYLGQLSHLERMKDSLMANCATKFIFACSSLDAKILEKEFLPNITESQLTNPKRYTANTILLIDGQKSAGFSLEVPAFNRK